VGLAGLGTVLPLLPTTPLLLLAAFAFARSSPRLHDWLLSHRVFGPLIADWQLHGAIGARAKAIALLSMAAVLAISIFAGVPVWLLITQAVVLAGAGAFVATRPNGPRDARQPIGRLR
jgi:hypothetical protein